MDTRRRNGSRGRRLPAGCRQSARLARHPRRRVSRRWHSMTAERRFAAGGSDVEATTGFEPLALCVDQADERDGDVEESAGEAGDSVEAVLGFGIEHLQCVQGGKAPDSFGGIGGVSMSRNLRQPPAAHSKCQFLTGRASPSPCGGFVDALACGDEEDRRGPARRRSGAVFPA